MEHVVGLELAENLFHPVCTTDAGDDCLCRDVGIVALHHETDIVLWGFCLVDEHHGCRLIDGYLSYHLGTNATGCTCDENASSSQHLADRIHIDLDL